MLIASVLCVDIGPPIVDFVQDQAALVLFVNSIDLLEGCVWVVLMASHRPQSVDLEVALADLLTCSDALFAENRRGLGHGDLERQQTELAREALCLTNILKSDYIGALRLLTSLSALWLFEVLPGFLDGLASATKDKVCDGESDGDYCHPIGCQPKPVVLHHSRAIGRSQHLTNP